MTDQIVINKGNNNRFSFVKMKSPPSKIEIYGDGNTITLSEEADLKGFSIKIKGNNNNITINKKTLLRGLVYVNGHKSSLYVDNETTAAGVRFTVGARSSILLGKDCMLSRNIEIRCWDEHPIYDLDSREEINTGKDVIIGEHVWIGEGATLNKGVTIASGCVIGSGSTVSKNLLEANSIYAGVPAKKIRSRIAWARSPKIMDWEQSDFTGSTAGKIP